MTARQAEIWDLYARGHGPSEIAVALGLKSRGGVSSALKKIKQELQSPTKRVMESAACRYSSSCFSCPLRDCAIESTKAARVNLLPWDMEWGGV